MGLFKILELGKPVLKRGLVALTYCPLKFETIQGIHMMIRQYTNHLPLPDVVNPVS
jgi:hypothetical protein